jgi:CheY-like chemotaxis protein
MAEDVLLHAFEPFFTTKGVGHGTGLGLSQVRGFVEQSGGHIRIDSRLGAGTAVELWLARAAEAPAEPPEAASAPPTAGAGETVLVVEDDPDVRAFVTRSLRALDYRVLQAGDGPSALRLAEAEPIDLLFTDLMLPGGLEGPALAEAVLRCRPGVPVLFTSGYPERFPADQLNHPVLPKPFSTVELSLAIRRALAPAGAEPVA